MKKLLLVISIIMSVSSGLMSAQTPADLVREIRAAAEDACVTVTYALKAKVDDATIEDSGTVVAQDDLWFLKGQTIAIYTFADGTWILHPESKEAVVEPKWTFDDLVSFYETIRSSAGNDMDVVVLSEDVSEKKPVMYFSPEVGQDWVVTDLR